MCQVCNLLNNYHLGKPSREKNGNSLVFCQTHEQSKILFIVLFKKMKWTGKIWTKYFLLKTFLQGAGHKLNTKAVRDKKYAFQ